MNLKYEYSKTYWRNN